MRLNHTYADREITPDVIEVTSTLTFTKSEVMIALQEFARLREIQCSYDLKYELFLLDEFDRRKEPDDAVSIRVHKSDSAHPAIYKIRKTQGEKR